MGDSGIRRRVHNALNADQPSSENSRLMVVKQRHRRCGISGTCTVLYGVRRLGSWWASDKNDAHENPRRSTEGIIRHRWRGRDLVHGFIPLEDSHLDPQLPLPPTRSSALDLTCQPFFAAFLLRPLLCKVQFSIVRDCQWGRGLLHGSPGLPLNGRDADALALLDLILACTLGPEWGLATAATSVQATKLGFLANAHTDGHLLPRCAPQAPRPPHVSPPPAPDYLVPRGHS